MTIEYANAGADRLAAVDEYADGRYDWLSPRTGLPVATIRELVVQRRLCDLYDAYGRLLPREDCVRKFGRPISGREAQAVLARKRFAPGTITPARAQRELYRMRRKGYPR